MDNKIKYFFYQKCFVANLNQVLTNNVKNEKIMFLNSSKLTEEMFGKSTIVYYNQVGSWEFSLFAAVFR